MDAGIITSNVDYLKRKHGLHSTIELAQLINKPPSTLYSYLKNPGRSATRDELARLAGVSPKIFEEQRLEDLENDGKVPPKNNPPNSLEDLTYKEAAHTVWMDISNEQLNDKEFMDARRKLVDGDVSGNIEFNLRFSKAVQAYNIGEYELALYAFESVILITNLNNYNRLNAEFFHMYFECCKRLASFAGVSALKDRIIFGDLHQYELAMMFGSLVSKYDRNISIEVMTKFHKGY